MLQVVCEWRKYHFFLFNACAYYTKYLISEKSIEIVSHFSTHHGSAAPATIIEGIISSFVETGMVNSFAKQLEVKEHDTVEPGEIKANVDEKKNMSRRNIIVVIMIGLLSQKYDTLAGMQFSAFSGLPRQRLMKSKS